MIWPHADYTAADVAFEDDLEHVADSGDLDPACTARRRGGRMSTDRVDAALSASTATGTGAVPERFAVLEVVGPFHGEDFAYLHLATGRCHGIYTHRDYAIDVARDAAVDAPPAAKVALYRVELLEVVPRGEVRWGITCTKGADGVCPAVDEHAAREVWRRWSDPRTGQECGPHDLVRQVDGGTWRTVLTTEEETTDA